MKRQLKIRTKKGVKTVVVNVNRAKPKQHRRRLKSGRCITVNKGVRRKHKPRTNFGFIVTKKAIIPSDEAEDALFEVSRKILETAPIDHDRTEQLRKAPKMRRHNFHKPWTSPGIHAASKRWERANSKKVLATRLAWNRANPEKRIVAVSLKKQSRKIFPEEFK